MSPAREPAAHSDGGSAAAAVRVPSLPLPADEKAELDAFLAENISREATSELLDLLRSLRAAKPDNPSLAKIAILHEAIYGELCRRVVIDPKAFYDELCAADIWDVFAPTLQDVVRSMPAPLTDAELAREPDYFLSTCGVVFSDETAERLIKRRCGIGPPRSH